MNSSVSSNKSTLPRGGSKHFVSSENKTTGAVDTIARLIHTEHTDDEDTLIDIKVNNPLKHIIDLLKDIKKRQATTFSLKFTIPLIALPVFLLAAFQIGRFQTVCTPTITSKVGILKTFSVSLPVENDSLITSVFNFFRTVPKIKSGIPLTNQSRSILVNNDGKTVNVLHAKSIDLSVFNDSNVIVTGNYSSCSESITLEAFNNILSL